MTMSITRLCRPVVCAALAAVWALAAFVPPALAVAASAERAAAKRAFKLPPSADLQYTVKASQRGFSLNGQSLVSWQVQDNSYAIVSDTRASMLGKIVESKSEGAIDDYGLAPAQMLEKRMRRAQTTTTFKRDSKTIAFSESTETYPIKGGEQDRSSVLWQLLSQARAAPDKFGDGAQATFFVAGRRDAETWTFKVVNQETVNTAMGPQMAIHLVKAPPPDSEDQRLDVWLAPGLEWYPVKLRFTDNDGDFVEQTLEKITRK